MTATATTATTDGRVAQYSLAMIVGVWALAALPMGVLAWVGAPLLARTFEGPNALGRALLITLAAGLVWQFVLVVILVRRELGSLRWPLVREALWLRPPESPTTGRRGGRLWLILVPLALAFAAEELVPSLPFPDSRDFGAFLGSDAGQSFLSGNWLWFGIIVTMLVFNTVLGEELLFRGLLLPRMQGVFGRWDWIANGVLFATYHVHVPWAMPRALLDTFVLAYPSRRFRSALIGIAVHSAQSLFFLALILALMLR